MYGPQFNAQIKLHDIYDAIKMKTVKLCAARSGCCRRECTGGVACVPAGCSDCTFLINSAVLCSRCVLELLTSANENSREAYTFYLPTGRASSGGRSVEHGAWSVGHGAWSMERKGAVCTYVANPLFLAGARTCVRLSSTCARRMPRRTGRTMSSRPCEEGLDSGRFIGSCNFIMETV